MATEESINSKPTGAEAIISNVSGQKNAVKMIWRDPETRDAFVYWADADTGLPLTSTDGYNLVEGGSFAQPTTQAEPAPAQPETPAAPVDPSIYETNQGSGGEAFDPYEAKAIAEEMTKLPGAKVDPQTGIISAPTPSSGGYISFDPNTGWSAYTNADGITTTFNANGDIIGGPGLSTALGTKSGAFLGDKVFSPADIPIVGALLSGPINAIKGAVSSIAKGVVDKALGLVGKTNKDGTISYNLGEDTPAISSVPSPTYETQTTPTIDTFAGYRDGFVPNAPAGSGDFSFGDVANTSWENTGSGVYDSLGPSTISGSKTAPTGVTTEGFMDTQGVTQSFSDISSFGNKDVIGVVEAGKGWTTVALADGSTETRSGDRASRNNNPGNLEYGDFAKSMGAVGTDGRFAVFANEDDGKKAMESLLSGPSYKDLSLTDAISRYAPAFENDTRGYINAVATAANVNPNATLSSLSPEQLSAVVDAMTSVEGNTGYAVTSMTDPTRNVADFSTNPLNSSNLNDKSLATAAGMKGFNEENISNRSLEARTEEEDKSTTDKSIESLSNRGLLSSQGFFFGTGLDNSTNNSLSKSQDTMEEGSFQSANANMSMPADSMFGQISTNPSSTNTSNSLNGFFGQEGGVPTSSTSTPSVSVPSGFFGQEGGVPQPATEEKGWQQSIVDAITPAIAPTLESVIGWGVSKALEGFNQQSQQNTQLGQISDPRGSISSIGSPPSSVSTDPTQTGPVAWGMEQSYLDSLEKDSAYRDAFDSANKASLSDILGVSDDRSMFSGFGLFDSDTGAGISVSGNAATGGAGSYSGPSGWETSGDAGIYDSLGSDTAIDYGAGFASAGVGTAASTGVGNNSGVGNASSGAGTAANAGSASSGAGTASNASNSNSNSSSNSGLGNIGASGAGLGSTAQGTSGTGGYSSSDSGWAGWW